jgi:hypothetical protein
MRRVPLLLAMLLAFTTMAAAQANVNPSQPSVVFGAAVNTTTVNPDIVIARLMTFDRNNDGVIGKGELPERMESLLVADRSGDGALDRDEIRVLAAPVPVAVAATVPGFRGGGGGYTFGDQVSLSTRAHVEGALDDLRLSPGTHQNALNIVRPFMAKLEADASEVLMKELEGLMPQRQHTTFKAMLDRQLSGNAQTMITQRNGMTVNVFRFGPDLTMMINSFQLGPEQTKLALDAFDGFKARIRPADADRAELLAGLKDVLSDEERENFGAALQRRPLVKAGGIIAGVVGGIAPPLPPPPPGAVIDGPAVFRMPFPPQRQVLTP